MKISNSHCNRASLISDLGLFSRAYSLGLRLTARGSIQWDIVGTDPIIMIKKVAENRVRPYYLSIFSP